MVNRLEPLNLVDFTGGLNLRSNTFQLQPNESPEMINISIDPLGGIYSRRGWERWNGPDIVDLDTRGWEYTLDQDHAESSVRIAGLRLMARLDWAPELKGALWTPEIAGEEWTSVLENYLRLLVAYRLLAEGGVLLHSAGVSDGRSAWLLLGPSGAGKTTASRLCLAAGAEVLSDDLNAARFPDGGGGPVVARLPFTALGWLPIGVVVAVILRARQPTRFKTLGRVFED